MPGPICPPHSVPPTVAAKDDRGRSYLFDTSWWLFFQDVATAFTAADTPTTTTPRYIDLTPAVSVTPTLEAVQENGVLSILLNRATTGIAPATLDGAYPPDGYRFTIRVINDGTDGRLLTWDALYLGLTGDEKSGAANATTVYNFTTLPSGAGFLLTSPVAITE